VTRPLLDILYVGMLRPHRGGSAVANSLILRGLAQRGHRVRAIAPVVAANSEDDGFTRCCPELEVTSYTLPYTDGSPDTPPSDEYRELERRQICELVPRLMEEGVPDVVLAGREAFAWYVPDVLGPRAPATAIVVHGSTTHGIVNGDYPAPLARGLLERLRRIDLTVTPAWHMAEVLRALGVPDAKVIRNPVELERFRPAPPDARLARALGIEEDDVVVVHPSNLKALKRVEDLFASAALALARDARLLYLILGDGPDRSELEAACLEAGVAERFRFAGWIEHERIPDYLRLADIVVMPSAAEAQALAYLEAQACARTLVASDIPAAREVIEDGVDGLLFRVGDVEHLTAVTLRAAADAALRSDIGRRARERVRAHDVSRVVSDYERLFAGLVRTSAASAGSGRPTGSAARRGTWSSQRASSSRAEAPTQYVEPEP
jgi:glycosyltransferase involved in cell wall biosynthesis